MITVVGRSSQDDQAPVHLPGHSVGPCQQRSTASLSPALRDCGLGEEGRSKVGQTAMARDQV